MTGRITPSSETGNILRPLGALWLLLVLLLNCRLSSPVLLGRSPTAPPPVRAPGGGGGEPGPSAPPPGEAGAEDGEAPGEAETGDGEAAPRRLVAAQGEITAQVQIAVFPESPRPGEPLTVALGFSGGPPGRPKGLPEKHFLLLLNGEGKTLARASFFPLDELPPGEVQPWGGGLVLWAAILAVPSTARPGTVRLRIEPALPGLHSLAGPPAPAPVSPALAFAPDGTGDLALTIGERSFVSEVIDLDQRNTSIRTEPDPQKTTEANQLWGILNRTGGDIYALGAFVPPVSSTRRTSFYGDRRVYRYVNGSTDTAIHAGVDYGVPLGTPVIACAPGMVALARFRIVTGYSVILEHLPGVYSLYYHLERIAVKEGDRIPAGALVGESGATGLATGPHLHWEIRIAGENADPDALVARPVLDKAEIISTMRAWYQPQRR